MGLRMGEYCIRLFIRIASLGWLPDEKGVLRAAGPHKEKMKQT
jgi:hypothetical protein